MNAHLKKVVAHHDWWAETYDSDYFEHFALYHKVTLDNIGRFVPEEKEATVLDAGGGTGIWSVELAKMGYKVVAPHFTIVFAVDYMNRKEFIEHVKNQAKGFTKIAFVLRSAAVVKDALSEYAHVFLVPDQGYSEIVKLHDKLYGDELALELRLDIPFIPHISIGNSIDPQDCRRLADQLNQQAFAIKGFIETLDVAKYENERVETIEQIKLV